MFATHGTRCPSRAEIIEMHKLTNLQSQIIANHEDRSSEYFSFSFFLSSRNETNETADVGMKVNRLSSS